MTLNILYAGAAAGFAPYAEAVTRHLAAAGLSADIACDHAPETVDYIICDPDGPITDFTPFTRTRAVLNLWAGVERLVANPTLTQPLARMVDPGLTQGMVEWVAGHVLRHHLGIDAQREAAAKAEWREDLVPPLAQERAVGILGLGVLGTAVAGALRTLGFAVSGWSRRAKTLPGILCHHGSEGLATLLGSSEILVLLLPETPAPRAILNRETLNALPAGAVVLNPGRGPLIDDAALLAALDRGHIAHATLDVFCVEPLPQDHPFWRHPGVTVTPHIASATRQSTAARALAENIAGVERGAPLAHAVDRGHGY